MLKQVFSPDSQRFFIHPAHKRLDVLSSFQQIIFLRYQISSADVYIIRQMKHGTLWSETFLNFLTADFYGFYGSFYVRRIDFYLVIHRENSAFHFPCIASVIMKFIHLRTKNQLHWKSSIHMI